RAEFWVVTFAVTSFILFNGSFGESIISWGGGTATGPRQMVPAVPFMVLALVFLPRGFNYLFGALAALSTFIMLAATSVEPHFPYEYANPVRDFAMPGYYRADLAYNRAGYYGDGWVAGDTVAFNLGKLFGLPGPVQLWPLAAVWMAGSIKLLNASRPWPSVSKRRVADLAAAV